MITRRRISMMGLAALAAVMASSALAQGNAARPGAPQRPAVKNYIAELREMTNALAKRFNARVVVDPALFVQAMPRNPGEAQTIEAALDALASQIRGASWRRIYLTQVQAQVLPSADKLVDAVRSLIRIEQSGIVVEDPATRRATAYLKDYAVRPTFQQELEAQQFSAQPVYVLFGQTAGAGREGVDRFMDLQRQQFEMLQQMDPDTLSQALSQGMQMMMSLDPQTRGQLFGNMMRAGMQMWTNMPEGQRNQFIGEMMRMGQEMMSQMGGRPGGFPGGPPPPPRRP